MPKGIGYGKMSSAEMETMRGKMKKKKKVVDLVGKAAKMMPRGEK